MRTKQRHGVNDAAAETTTRLNIRVKQSAQRRLAVHCAMTSLSPGEVITRLIEGLREFSMPVNLIDRSQKSHRQSPVVCDTDSATPEPVPVAA
jgi:hypothetical protein